MDVPFVEKTDRDRLASYIITMSGKGFVKTTINLAVSARTLPLRYATAASQRRRFSTLLSLPSQQDPGPRRIYDESM